MQLEDAHVYEGNVTGKRSINSYIKWFKHVKYI